MADKKGYNFNKGRKMSKKILLQKLLTTSTRCEFVLAPKIDHARGKL